MERLKGAVIYIGKDAAQKGLSIAVSLHEKTQVTLLNEAGSVPNSVSRYQPQTNSAHCKIAIGNDGTMVLTNLKPENSTYVNGREVATKAITLTDVITLGVDNYPLPLVAVIQAVQKLLGIGHSIKHLESVWDEYECAIEKIKRQHQKTNKVRSLPILITTLSVAVCGILDKVMNIRHYNISIYIALISAIIWVVLYFKKDTSIEKQKAATNKLIDEYRTPCCKYGIGKTPYRRFRQFDQCPNCHLPFIKD